MRRGSALGRGQLPELGEWDGPIHGELGVLAVEPDGSRVQCHACGRWFRFLASHVTQVHRLSADEYRALFGLRAQTGLMSPAMKERRREQTAALLRRYAGAGLAVLRAMPAEEWRAINRGRRWRLEGRLDPRNRQSWSERVGRDGKATAQWRERLADPVFKARWARHLSEAQGGPAFVTCAVCGTVFRLKPSDAARSRRHACSPECLARLKRDPAYTAEIARKLSARKGGRVPVTCAVCGRSWEVKRSVASRSREHLCCRACLAEWQRRRTRPGSPLLSPAAHARGVATRRARWRNKPAEELAAFRANISQAARRRGREAADRLRVLPALAFEALPPQDREIVVRFYGLDGCEPGTAAELAAVYCVTTRAVRTSLLRTVRMLLGSDETKPEKPTRPRQL